MGEPSIDTVREMCATYSNWGRWGAADLRTGQIAQVRTGGAWGDYAGGPAPGLGLSTIDWLAGRDVAAVATDTFGVEVRPNETDDEFLVCGPPLPFTRAVGSPLNPMAVK